MRSWYIIKHGMQCSLWTIYVHLRPKHSSLRARVYINLTKTLKSSFAERSVFLSWRVHYRRFYCVSYTNTLSLATTDQVHATTTDQLQV